MKLAYPNNDIVIEFEEGRISTLCIENPKAYREMVGDLWHQLNGNVGNWVLSEKEKILQISKFAVGIFNPLALDCNERKVLNKVYAELNEIVLGEFQNEIAEINGKIVELLDSLMGHVPYHMEVKPELDVGGLLKLFDVRLEDASGGLFEHVLDYLRVMHNICKIDLFLFFNIKQYFTDDELNGLYEFAIYEKIQLLLLEGTSQRKIVNSCEKCWIFDRDSCMIEVN